MIDQIWRDFIEAATLIVEVSGVAVILGGMLLSAGLFARQISRDGGEPAYRQLRSNLGRSILLGLELLVAADIIHTVAVEPTLQGVIVLAGIVLIRTFLSFAIEIELEGRWPWQRASS